LLSPTSADISATPIFDPMFPSMYASARFACHTDSPPGFKVIGAEVSGALVASDSLPRRLDASLRQRQAIARLLSKRDIARLTSCPI
jgi:hypothetical protein